MNSDALCFALVPVSGSGSHPARRLRADVATAENVQPTRARGSQRASPPQVFAGRSGARTGVGCPLPSAVSWTG